MQGINQRSAPGICMKHSMLEGVMMISHASAKHRIPPPLQNSKHTGAHPGLPAVVQRRHAHPQTTNHPLSNVQGVKHGLGTDGLGLGQGIPTVVGLEKGVVACHAPSLVHPVSVVWERGVEEGIGQLFLQPATTTIDGVVEELQLLERAPRDIGQNEVTSHANSRVLAHKGEVVNILKSKADGLEEFGLKVVFAPRGDDKHVGV